MASSPQTVPVGIPDPKTIWPYLGLFTMITLKDPGPQFRILTPYLPKLSIIRGRKFVKAPANISASANTACRIFDPLAIDHGTPVHYGAIPVSPRDPEFGGKRYWKLPIPPGAVLATLLEGLRHATSNRDDIKLAKALYHALGVQSLGVPPPDGSRINTDDIRIIFPGKDEKAQMVADWLKASCTEASGDAHGE
jgi:hypothetical protein